jgi:hypothetical protein
MECEHKNVLNVVKENDQFLETHGISQINQGLGLQQCTSLAGCLINGLWLLTKTAAFLRRIKYHRRF